MDTYQTQDGSNQTRLNLVQRKTSLPSSYPRQCTNHMTQATSRLLVVLRTVLTRTEAPPKSPVVALVPLKL
jgi:hypothetical protein